MPWVAEMYKELKATPPMPDDISMEDFNELKKLGKLSEKQTHFINLFVGGIDVEDILDELSISK